MSSKFEILSFDRYPDYLAPAECTHIVFQSSGHSFWKLQEDICYKWDGYMQWILYKEIEPK